MNRGKLLVITERFLPEQFLVNEIVPEFVAAGFRVTVITQVPSYPMDRIYPGFSNTLLSKTREMGATVLRTRTVLGYQRSVLKKMLNYLSFAFLASMAVISPEGPTTQFLRFKRVRCPRPYHFGMCDAPMAEGCCGRRIFGRTRCLNMDYLTGESLLPC